jgi:hypothetical protein
MYGEIPTVSKNINLEEAAELAYLILLDPDEYSSESPPQLLANVRQATSYTIEYLYCLLLYLMH